MSSLHLHNYRYSWMRVAALRRLFVIFVALPALGYLLLRGVWDAVVLWIPSLLAAWNGTPGARTGPRDYVTPFAHQVRARRWT
jgi:hypothetical protein